MSIWNIFLRVWVAAHITNMSAHSHVCVMCRCATFLGVQLQFCTLFVAKWIDRNCYFVAIFMTFYDFWLVYLYIFEFQANGRRPFQFLPKPSKSMQPQPCLLWKEANVSWNCPSQMLVFVIVLELSKLIRIMLLLINTAEEPTGKHLKIASNCLNMFKLV